MNQQQYFNYMSKRFKRSFSESHVPAEWVCPHCKRGHLVSLPVLEYSETELSRQRRDDPDWEPDWEQFQFTAKFRCSFCPGETLAIGTGSVKIYYDQYEGGEQVFSKEFTPVCFYPPLPLFRAPEGTPAAVTTAIQGAFSVAWADIPAGGNRLRVAIERLVEELLPKTDRVKKLRVHGKIEELRRTRPDIADPLLAVKWLGNEASHQDSLREHDLAFGFEVVELVLNELYDNRRSEIDPTVKAINDLHAKRK